jgi:S1-C subfamily serine protease
MAHSILCRLGVLVTMSGLLCVARAEVRSPFDEVHALQQQVCQVAEEAAHSVFAVTALPRVPSDAALFARQLSGTDLVRSVAKQERSCGTAFAIDHEGLLLTSEHVISGAASVWVTDDAGRSFPALVVGSDPRSDLAVLRIPVDTKPLTLARAAPARGELVVTLGNPDGSATEGAMCAAVGNVSVADRSLPRLSERERRNYGHMIQVTTPITVGSSGGPLLNLEGMVLGVVCAVATPASETATPIGFATNLSSAAMRDRIDRLSKGEEIVYGYLGVMVSPELRPDAPRGVRVDRVDADTPAAGVLKEGDVVLSFDGTPVLSDRAFIELAGTGSIDRDVPVRVLRGDTELDLTVRPRRRLLPATPVTTPSQRFTWAGVTFRNHEAVGVVVEEVDLDVEDAPRIGTLVRQVNGDPIQNLTDLMGALHRHAGTTLSLDDAPLSTNADND